MTKAERKAYEDLYGCKIPVNGTKTKNRIDSGKFAANKKGVTEEADKNTNTTSRRVIRINKNTP